MRARGAIQAAATAALLALAAPSAVAAGPLLSGYGGPGQGDQAILGSTLIGASSGGGGNGAGAATDAGSALPARQSAPRAADRSSGRRSGTRESGEYRVPTRVTTTETAVTTQPLGLSTGDLFYVLLALAALAVTAACTRLLSQQRPR
jgi:hypothetical protein